MQSTLEKLASLARIPLGLVFFVFGVNGFLGFLPAPDVPAEAASFLAALGATGYFFPVLKGTEILAGAALLTNRLVPLALVVLAPIVVHIVLFHGFLDPDGLAIPMFVLLGELALAWHHRDSFRGLLRGAERTRSTRVRFAVEAAA